MNNFTELSLKNKWVLTTTLQKSSYKANIEDLNSEWIEVFASSTETARATLSYLIQWFAWLAATGPKGPRERLCTHVALH